MTLRDTAIERVARYLSDWENGAWAWPDNVDVQAYEKKAAYVLDAALATLREHLLARRAAAYQMPSPEAIMALREIDTLIALLAEREGDQ